MDQSCEEHLSSHQCRQEGDVYDEDHNNTKPESFFLDNIIVGYAFGQKKMETMGLIMAEASKALSTFECSGTLSSMINKQRRPNNLPMQKQQNNDTMELFEESSMATMTTVAGGSMLTSLATGDSSEDVEKESVARTRYFSDNDEDTRSVSSTYTRSSFISQRSQQKGSGSGTVNGIQLTFLPDSSGFIHLVRTASSGGGGIGGEGESITGSSVATTSATTTTLGSYRKQGASTASCSSMPTSFSSSLSKEMNDSPFGVGSMVKQSQFSSRRSNSSGCSNRSIRRHPIRVSFVPIDLDTPLEEQHGGKFDVILHKMTEDILSMSKMLRARGRSCGDLDQRVGNDDHETVHRMPGPDGMQPLPAPALAKADEDRNIFESTPSMTRQQARASRRIQRLNEYKQKVHPSCVLVDSPNNILAVMSRADMAEVLSRCLAGVTTKGGIPVRTPRFRVVDEDSVLEVGNGSESTSMRTKPSLPDEIENSGFEYPLIAKPLTAAGTKTSHHMGIVLARDGLQWLKTPCLLQEYANHGEKLFKVYVLGDSVWVFSRESLPNLPMGEKHMSNDAESCLMQGERSAGGDASLRSPQKRPRTESYVEFERPAGSRCYVEFNSQRPYPKLSDFGIVSQAADNESLFHKQDDVISDRCGSPRRKRQRPDGRILESYDEKEHQQSTPKIKLDTINNGTIHGNPDLARYVTKDEIEPVTAALRGAFGLELFGFDVLVKHNQNNPVGNNDDKEILVVDVNYFPGYKEVPNFPSLLAQYLTQKAVESRVRNFDGS
mmetsp:Transcript_8868/g.19904  ORF Transcript_8868/g.19904 Transcript_8868/m.19904 type:complete len:777 (-) Transcript_8868:237-2567(-)|eukprot:CAMPEP_0172321920 /NCGR_PEP_ID=MMETSP1058-20130122/44654_1 /TAXON_ID=83371 /ORGANISM="Detonula confervacea, Strain CCMP 353" /LENGTH=776 /DNA_ID=CAMNT_0013037541 /DNA_START=372 /DNA_END=2702 /DNA_ORIENTATION=+